MAKLKNKKQTGRYLSGSRGPYVPSPLPRKLTAEMTERLFPLLSKADRAVARLDGATAVLPDPDLFVYMFAKKEAVDSSKIEGTQATLTDVLKAEAEYHDPAIPPDVEQARAYIKAMNESLGRLSELPLSLRLIREMHQTLMSNVTRGSAATPGEFRRTQVWIGPENSEIEHATYIPPPPGSSLNNCLKEFERFLHEDRELPVLISAGLAHAQFETIHPFLDGNGRVGRMLITLMLCQREVLEWPLLYLSTYLKRNVQTYYQHLQRIRDQSDWLGWLEFFLIGVAETANSAAEAAKAIVRLRERDRGRLIEELGKGAGSGLAVLESLYELPVISISRVSEIAGLRTPAASVLVHKLERLEIVQEITGRQRNQRYIYDDYVALFTD